MCFSFVLNLQFRFMTYWSKFVLFYSLQSDKRHSYCHCNPVLQKCSLSFMIAQLLKWQWFYFTVPCQNFSYNLSLSICAASCLNQIRCFSNEVWAAWLKEQMGLSVICHPGIIHAIQIFSFKNTVYRGQETFASTFHEKY